MNKLEILKKLHTLKLDPQKYIVISGAALVVQNITSQTGDIDLATSTSYYNSINWPEKMGHMKKPIKYFDIFEISNNLYEEDAEVTIIDGYRFLNLSDILKTKKQLNRPKDYEIIQTLEKLLDQNNQS